MSTDAKIMLKHKGINGWSLFWLVSVPMSVVMLVEMVGTDMSTAPGVSHMIGFSVRWAVPFIYLVVAASALPVLFPGSFTTWLLRNRKYIGMCFAVAMAWQGAFIFLMSNFYREYYFDEIYYLRDELEGSTGYIFLAARIAFGLLVAATGLQWQEPVTAFLTGPGWSANLELWLPYWPFEPFLSLVIVGLGTMLVSRSA